MVNFSTRPGKVQELIQLIGDDEEAQDIARAIHFQNTFPFTYDVRESAGVTSDFPDPGHEIDDFKSGATVAVEFQVLSRNFKTSKRVDTIKAYSFRLLGVYLVDDPMHSAMSTPDKRRRGDDEWMITPPRTNRTITRMAGFFFYRRRKITCLRSFDEPIVNCLTRGSSGYLHCFLKLVRDVS